MEELGTTTPGHEFRPNAKLATSAPSDMRIRVKRKLQFTSCYEFKKIWADNSKGAGITFFRVKPPKEFCALGDFAEPHHGDLPNNPASFFAIRERVRKTEEPARPGDPPEPEDFPLLVRPKEFVAISQDRSRVTLWRPVPPSDDYAALGCVATEPESSETPDIDSVLCVHKSVLAKSSKGFLLWADQKQREGGRDISVWVVVPPLKDAFFHPATFVAVAPHEEPTGTPFYYFRRHSAIEVLGVSLEAFKVNYGDLTEKVRHPDTGIPFERKKKSLKALKASSTKKYFNGASAVDWLIKEYGLKSRKEGVMLGEQLRRIGVLTRKDDAGLSFVDDQHVRYSFNDFVDSSISTPALASAPSSSSTNGHGDTNHHRALAFSDGDEELSAPPSGSLIKPFLPHQAAPKPKLSPAVNNFGRQSIEGHAKRKSMTINKAQSSGNFGGLAIVVPPSSASASVPATPAAASFTTSSTTTTTTPSASASVSASFNGSSSSPPVSKRSVASGDHHPHHHQHLHAKLSQRGGKFASLTKKDRERMLDRERYDILNNGTADDHQSVGVAGATTIAASGSVAEGSKKEKKEGLIKGTFRGLVKPKGKGNDDHHDGSTTTTTTTTTTPSDHGREKRSVYRLSGLSVSAAAGLHHALSPAASPSPAPTIAVTAPKPGRLFGVALEEVVRQPDLTSDALALPRFVEHALAFLEREENIVTLGLFRIAGKKPDADALRAAYDEGGAGVDMAATHVHPHTVAGVLKLFLRSLPETLLTAHAYTHFLDAAQAESTEVAVERLKEQLEQLPEINYVLLERLVRFFVLLTAHAEVNKMTASNVGALIGPNLVRREETDAQVLFKETNLLNSLVEVLITHHPALFQRVCAPKEPAPAPAVDAASREKANATANGGEDGSGGEERRERERMEGMEEWEGSDDESAAADDFAGQPDGGGGGKKKWGGAKLAKKADKDKVVRTDNHRQRLSLSIKDDVSTNNPRPKKMKKEKKKDREKKEKKDQAPDDDTAQADGDGEGAGRRRSLTQKTTSAESRRVPMRERLSSSDRLSITARRSVQLSSLDLGSLRGAGHTSSGAAGVDGGGVSWSIDDSSRGPPNRPHSTTIDGKRPIDAILEHLQPPPPPADGGGGDDDDGETETTAAAEVVKETADGKAATMITRFGQEVERDLVKLRKGSLEQMVEVVKEKEVMRITKLVREREVEEVKKISRVKHMKEVKEREIQDMAERAALERELKRRERRKSTLMVHELVHKMLATCPPPPEVAVHTDTEQVLRERKAEKNREFFEKKITEGKVRSKEEIEAEVRLGLVQGGAGNRKASATHPPAKDPIVAAKLALFEEGHSQD